MQARQRSSRSSRSSSLNQRLPSPGRRAWWATHRDRVLQARDNDVLDRIDAAVRHADDLVEDHEGRLCVCAEGGDEGTSDQASGEGKRGRGRESGRRRGAGREHRERACWLAAAVRKRDASESEKSKRGGTQAGRSTLARCRRRACSSGVPLIRANERSARTLLHSADVQPSHRPIAAPPRLPLGLLCPSDALSPNRAFKQQASKQDSPAD